MSNAEVMVQEDIDPATPANAGYKFFISLKIQMRANVQ